MDALRGAMQAVSKFAGDQLEKVKTGLLKQGETQKTISKGLNKSSNPSEMSSTGEKVQNVFAKVMQAFVEAGAKISAFAGMVGKTFGKPHDKTAAAEKEQKVEKGEGVLEEASSKGEVAAAVTTPLVKTAAKSEEKVSRSEVHNNIINTYENKAKEKDSTMSDDDLKKIAQLKDPDRVAVAKEVIQITADNIEDKTAPFRAKKDPAAIVGLDHSFGQSPEIKQLTFLV